MYKVKCKKCGATCWVRGEHEPDTNVTVITEEDLVDMEGGDDECPHDNYDILNEQDSVPNLDDILGDEV